MDKFPEPRETFWADGTPRMIGLCSFPGFIRIVEQTTRFSLRQDKQEKILDKQKIFQDVPPGFLPPGNSGQLSRDFPQNPKLSDSQLLLDTVR